MNLSPAEKTAFCSNFFTGISEDIFREKEKERFLKNGITSDQLLPS